MRWQPGQLLPKAPSEFHPRATRPTHCALRRSGMRETYASVGSLVDVLLWRDGGQRHARRNAWRAMVADNVRARDRAEAAASLPASTAAVSSEHGASSEGRHVSG